MKKLFHYLDRKGCQRAAKVVRAIYFTVSFRGDWSETYVERVIRMWKAI